MSKTKAKAKTKAKTGTARGPITEVTAGSGKSAIKILFDETKVPGRGASTATKLAFAAGYFQRFLDGEKVSKKTMELAVRYVGNAAEEARVAARKEKLDRDAFNRRFPSIADGSVN